MVKVIYQTVVAMTMPFTLSLAVTDEVAGQALLQKLAGAVLADLKAIEDKFSAFRPDSLVSRYRAGEKDVMLDRDFQEVYVRSLAAQEETAGGFDPYFEGAYNPTGLVKGWAIERVFNRHLKPVLAYGDVEAVCLNGAGDMQLATSPVSDFIWQVGVERADNLQELVTRLSLKDGAVATSGYSKKGNHIVGASSDLAQVTVVALSLTEADLWATALLALPEEDARAQIAQHKLSGLYQTVTGTIYFQHGGFQNV